MVGWDLASTVTIEKSYENADKNVNFVEFSTLADVEPCSVSRRGVRLRNQVAHPAKSHALRRASHGCAGDDLRQKMCWI